MDDLELCLYDLKSFQTIWKVSGRSRKCPDHPENVAGLSKFLQNHLLCAFVANLKIDAICKLQMRSTRKVFANKNSLSGKFSLFLTLILSHLCAKQHMLKTQCLIIQLLDYFNSLKCLILLLLGTNSRTGGWRKGKLFKFLIKSLSKYYRENCKTLSIKF